MELRIIIRLDNDAFTDQPCTEVARILEKYATVIKHDGELDASLRDINGNVVGYARQS